MRTEQECRNTLIEWAKKNMPNPDDFVVSVWCDEHMTTHIVFKRPTPKEVLK